ncbi:MAG: DUF2141 domain-containing protein [Blastomonas fulva]|jgi:uncharacterized protein (DUF2141 family)|uniref:DUF2141 domain-containing protein n=1 Tax=Blastomonas fulva TaxID=1550728 RepID=UPI0024E1CA05|nr:DUF2141 domain-containing protein [Blastomonas fulva]MDK2758894.1 DUF2141 domain-containing protein [Blastomonas fulva]
MKYRSLLLTLLLVPGPVYAQLRSTPDLGIAEGRCRSGESGPAFLITVMGLKDRRGQLRLELYPPGDDGFLQDDNILVAAGKTFRRVEQTLPKAGPVRLCIRVPAAGTYTLSILHDRDANRKFGVSTDGIGFPNDPQLGMAKPKASAVRAVAGTGLTPISIRMNYRKGLFSFGPIGN